MDIYSCILVGIGLRLQAFVLAVHSKNSYWFQQKEYNFNAVYLGASIACAYIIRICEWTFLVCGELATFVEIMACYHSRITDG